MLGQGVAPGVGAGELAETYGVFLAGTDQLCPAERVPVVRALHGQPSHEDDLEIRKPDGAVIPIEVWGRPVYGAGGQVDYGITAFADTSERNAREKIIAGQAALLELAHDAIFVRDLDGQITYWNAGAEDTYGFTSAEAVGRRYPTTCSARSFPSRWPASRPAWPGMAAGTASLRTGAPTGGPSSWRAAGRRSAGPAGPLLGFMEINRDITARKDAEREALRRAEEIRALNATLEQRVRQRTVHLERANKNLAAFTYSAAHDLRTPLRAISGFAEVLARSTATGSTKQAAGTPGASRRPAGSMATVLDDLLHLSRVSRAEMNLQDVDLSAEVTAICDQLRTRDPGRRVRVTVEDGVRVIADRALIRTVLENLLDNAWKFTAGRDDATIEFATTPADDAPICCYVRDNGAGFDPAYVGQAVPAVPAAPRRQRVPRHRHRPGQRPAHHRPPRRPDLGRRRRRPRRHHLLHPRREEHLIKDNPPG